MLFAVATHLPRIEFVKGIPENLERDSYFDVNILLSIFRGRVLFFFLLTNCSRNQFGNYLISKN